MVLLNITKEDVTTDWNGQNYRSSNLVKRLNSKLD